MSMNKLASYETLLTMAGEEVAVGKELKYFWHNRNAVITKHRRNIKRTLLELHSKKRVTDKLETAEGTYQVKEYSIPSIKWIKELVCYSHRIYCTQVAGIDEIYMDIETRPLFDDPTQDGDGNMIFSEATLGVVLSPDAFKTAIKQITQYNSDWEAKSEITKHPIDAMDLHGFFDSEGEYYITNRNGNRTYSQMLGITSDMFNYFGSSDTALDVDALVQAMTSMKDSE